MIGEQRANRILVSEFLFREVAAVRHVRPLWPLVMPSTDSVVTGMGLSLGRQGTYFCGGFSAAECRCHALLHVWWLCLRLGSMKRACLCAACVQVAHSLEQRVVGLELGVGLLTSSTIYPKI